MCFHIIYIRDLEYTVVRTSPAHGTAYDIAGKNQADAASFRQAVYAAIDIFRNRQRYDQAYAHPLRKQYYEKRDDSDKLKLDARAFSPASASTAWRSRPIWSIQNRHFSSLWHFRRVFGRLY